MTHDILHLFIVVICQAQSDIPLTWRFNFALWPMLYVMEVHCGFPSAL